MAVVTVAFSELDSWLQAQPENTPSTPYELNITGLNQSRIGSSRDNGTLGYILNQNSTKYVDLSETVFPSLPSGQSILYETFFQCTSLVQPPILSSNVTILEKVFYGCTNLANAPIIPSSATSMKLSFFGCSALVNAPTIPTSVTNMAGMFGDCTQLTNIKFETKSFSNISYSDITSVFENCTNLTMFYCDVPYELKTWLTNIKTRSINNFPNDVANCTFKLYSDVAEISINDLENELSVLSTNTLSTPYKIKITELTITDIENKKIKNVLWLFHSEEKYIDLSPTILPSGITSLEQQFTTCQKMVKSPILPEGVVNLKYTFLGSYNLTEAPAIPSTVQNMEGTFQDCYYQLRTPPSIPIGVTNIKRCFSGCWALETPPTLPETITILDSTFYECHSLTQIPLIPQGVSSLDSTFYDCRSLTQIEIDFNAIDIISMCFSKCSSLTTVKIKNFDSSNISSYASVFNKCTNLTEFYSDTPYELKTWLDTIYSASTNNFPNDPDNCTFRLYSDKVEIAFSDLKNELRALSNNTTSTPFKIKVTGLVSNDLRKSSISGTLGETLYLNRRKFVDLSETVIPNDVTSLQETFMRCESLIKSPIIPSGVTTMKNTFSMCYSLKETPEIPDSVTNLNTTFSGCTSLTESSEIPVGVTDMYSTFAGCSLLIKVKNIPNSVTDLEGTFYECSALEEIEEFDVPLSVLKTNAEDCFYGCSSLTSIGVKGVVPTEATEWHALRLNFGNDNVSGKVYNKNKNATTIPQTTIVKNTLKLPIKTDELWFPPNTLNDEQVDNIIKDVIDTKRTFFNKNVMSPKDKSFVLWKDEHSNFVSNIDFGGGGGGSGITVYNTEEELEEDLPTIPDDTIVATYGDGKNEFQDAPLGSIMEYLGTSDPADGKWLICDGRDTTGTAIELETHYPSLFMFLGGTNVLPDLREMVLVGAGENTTDGITTHDIYSLGQFKDDQVQGHEHWVGYKSEKASGTAYNLSPLGSNIGSNKTKGIIPDDVNGTPRVGETTHGKQKGVNYIIKAISEIDTYHLPSDEIAEVEQYVDAGLDVVKGKVAQAESYSTTEQITGGKWIDNKPIYRRVIQGTLTTGREVDIAFDHTDYNIETFVSMRIQAEDLGGIFSEYYNSSSDYLNFYYSKDNKYIAVRRGSSYPALPVSFFVVIEYTKTTD